MWVRFPPRRKPRSSYWQSKPKGEVAGSNPASPFGVGSSVVRAPPPANLFQAHMPPRSKKNLRNKDPDRHYHSGPETMYVLNGRPVSSCSCGKLFVDLNTAWSGAILSMKRV